MKPETGQSAIIIHRWAVLCGGEKDAESRSDLNGD